MNPSCNTCLATLDCRGLHCTSAGKYKRRRETRNICNGVFVFWGGFYLWSVVPICPVVTADVRWIFGVQNEANMKIGGDRGLQSIQVWIGLGRFFGEGFCTFFY